MRYVIHSDYWFRARLRMRLVGWAWPTRTHAQRKVGNGVGGAHPTKKQGSSANSFGQINVLTNEYGRESLSY